MPALAVSLGDPRGIGPEVAAAAGRKLLQSHPGLRLTFLGAKPAIDLPGDLVEEPFDGSQRSAGLAAGNAVRRAVELTLAGEFGAVVTAPIHKPGFQEAGFAYPGHTEFLQGLTASPEVGMLMAAETTVLGGPLRVLLATTHVALREVPELLTSELLEGQARLLHHELRVSWGIASPRIALCAFNPHAGDDGLFGDEESRIYAPAQSRLRGAGINAIGPVPADTVFARAAKGEFDAVIAPYHDVGMAAFKTASFGSGVNVTLGLPFPRTSPDHGTAFDLVGSGQADASSMLEAMELALRLAKNRLSGEL